MGDGKGRARNIAMEELIGRRAKVSEHTSKGLVGIEGLVLDETRNTLTIGCERGRVMVPKKGARFEFPGSPGGSPTCELDGEALMFRPEDRIKRCERVRGGPVREEDQMHDH